MILNLYQYYYQLFEIDVKLVLEFELECDQGYELIFGIDCYDYTDI